MSKRDPYLLIEDILDSIAKILSYTSGMEFKDFKEDSKTVDAVIRNSEIIGEAANQLPVEFKSEYRHIKWNQITGLRNRVIHEYFGVDLNIIWKIANEDLE